MIILPLLALLAVDPPASDRSVDVDDPGVLREYVASVIRDGGSGDPAALPAGASEHVRRWVAEHRQSLVAVREATAPGTQPWGLVARGPAAGNQRSSPIYLFVFEPHAGGKLVVYGLTGGVKKAYLFDDPDRAALAGMRLGKSTVYTIPKQSWNPLATVVVLQPDGELETARMVTTSDAGGRILLHARDAVVHGRVVRYEPEPHKDTIGYWTDPKDWVSWQFEIATPGVYRVDILQGCGKGSGGSKVDLIIGDQVLSVQVEDTGGFQNFVSRDVGRVGFEKPGLCTLAVKPRSRPGVAVMDLRQVTLTPVRQ